MTPVQTIAFELLSIVFIACILYLLPALQVKKPVIDTVLLPETAVAAQYVCKGS